MSTVETRKFEPVTGTALNLGASGDAVTLPAGVTLQTNTIKDAGGNTIFTSDGAGTLSSVNSGLQGDMVFISSQTASSSASLSFTSGIDSTYDEYVIYCSNMNPATNTATFSFQGTTDGTNFNTTITSTYFHAEHDETDGSASLSYAAEHDQAQGTSFQVLNPVCGNVSDEAGGGCLHLFSPSNTTYVKHFYWTGQYYHASNFSINSFVAGYMNTTSAVTGLQFKFSSGNINAGTIYLYGIK